MRPSLRLCVVLSLLYIASPARGAEPAAPADEKELPGEAHSRAALKAELTEVRFDGAGLTEVIDFLRDVTGQNIYVDWPAFDAAKVDRNAPVTVNLKVTTLADGLAAVLSQAGAKGLAAAPVGGVIVVSTPERTKAIAARFRRLADKPKTREQRGLDRTLPEVNFQANGFEDVVNFLTDVSGMTIAVDWKSLERAGVAKNTPITLRARKILFLQALQLLLESAGEKSTLDFTIDEKNVITIALEAGPV